MTPRFAHPGIPPEAVCEKCGRRNDAHDIPSRVRHPFVSLVEPTDPWPEIEKVNRKQFPDLDARFHQIETILRKQSEQLATLKARLDRLAP